MRTDQSKSSHILNTSATLFGLCFVVFTSLKTLRLDGQTLIDEFTAVSMVMFMTSCLLSFLSIRGNRKAALYEKIADYSFLAGLFTLFVITVFVVFNIVQ